MLANATLLSVVYLGFGLAVELVRRTSNARWAEWLCFALDALPEGALRKAHLLGTLQAAYEHSWVNDFMVRLIFGATTLLIIFGTAFLVGAAMWIARAWVERASKARA